MGSKQIHKKIEKMQTKEQFEKSEKLLFQMFQINETYDPNEDDLVFFYFEHKKALLQIISLGNEACKGRSPYFRKSLERNNFSI